MSGDLNGLVLALSARCEQPAAQFAALVENASRIYIGTHIDPDGDAIGSLLGLASMLQEIGKSITLACADPVPKSYRFLPGSNLVIHHPPTDEDLIIILDAGSLDRIGNLYASDVFAGRSVINIDHHVTNTGFGEVIILDPEAAATAEILYLLFMWLNLPVSLRTATCLLTGIVTDTRSFRTSNTKPRVVQVAAGLMQGGAPLAEIARQVFESKPVASLHLLGQALQVMRRSDRIIWTQVTQEMLRACGATAEDASSVINLLNSTRDADVAILFREDNDGSIDVGFRSKPTVNVSEIAVALGGGGHPQASGCRLSGPLPEVRERVLATVRSMRQRAMQEPATE